MSIILNNTQVTGVASIRTNNGAATAINISSGGQVNYPNTPAFWVEGHARNAGVDLASWYSVRTNNGSHFNNSNGRFTAPVAGTYYFFAAATGLDGHQPSYPAFRVNGSQVTGGAFHMDAGFNDDQGAVMLYLVRTLSANDYVTFIMGAYADFYESNIMFGGYLVG